MVSLLIDIGNGIFEDKILDEILDPKSKLPKKGIKLVSPDGLILYKIIYPKNINFQVIAKKIIIESKVKPFINKHNSQISILNMIEKEIL